MSLDPMHTPGNLNWDPASVELPEIPMLPPGEDAMSMTIAGVLPTLTAPMAASVAALQAKETMFSGKLGAAESAYQNADDSGRPVGGAVRPDARAARPDGAAGRRARAATRPAGGPVRLDDAAGHAGGSGWRLTPGGGSSAAMVSPLSGQGQSSAGSGAAGAGAAPQQTRDDGSAADHDQPSDQRDRDAREAEAGQGRPPLDAAAPGATPHGAGPAPVAPPRHGDGEDLAGGCSSARREWALAARQE